MKIQIFLGLIIILSLSATPIIAQESRSLIEITTDKKLYDEGNTIVISGKVSTVIVGEPITMQIFYEGNVVDIAQFGVAKDGSFTHTLLAEGPLWANEGEYTVRGFYGGEIAEVVFDFTKKKEVPETTKIFEVDAGSSGTFDVEYTIRGGEVKNMIVDPEMFTLIVVVDSTADGTISLNLPRESIDAKKQDGKDDTFIILFDGIVALYQESTTREDSRIITINFEEGDSDIEVIGTFVIPEFGTISTLVLIIGICTIILVTRNRFQLKTQFVLN